jgi:hypothetical protein
LAKLRETIVQVEALHFLRNRYRRRAFRGRIYAQTEVRTKPKYGGKRADGLIAYRRLLSGVEVIAIEAKSSKTLPSMKPIFKLNRFVWNCIKAGFLIAILTGAFCVFYKFEDFTTRILVPLNTFAVGALLYGLLTFNNYRHCEIPVISQLKQYPGNEQWLAFSKDSLERISKKKMKDMKRICKAKSVGMLSVSPRGTVKVLVKAKHKSKFWGDYLSYYSAEEEIRNDIQ